MKESIKQFCLQLWQDRAVFVFAVIALGIILGLVGYGAKQQLLMEPAVRLGLVLATVNYCLALLAFQRVKLLCIMLLWASSFIGIYSLIYVVKTLL